MDMYLNLRLVEFLDQKNISQEQLRLKLGLKSRQEINSWLNCREKIPAKHLMSIIDLFPDLNINWLIRNSGSPFIDQKSLRIIYRNEYGFCENCLDKEKEIEMLRAMLEKKEKEIKEIYMECGKISEKLHQYEQNGSLN